MEETKEDIMVSVIIPVYNTEAYLEECIISVVGQTYQELEIILINDGSTDHSGNICRKWESRDLRIRYVEKINEGQGITRNLGIALARGEYLLFVDSDDYLDRTLIERVLSCIKENEADICVFAHYGINDEGLKDESLLPYKVTKASSVEKNHNLLGYMMPILWDKMFSASLVKYAEVKMDNRICEDLVFNARLYVRAEKICMLDVPLYYYRYKREGNLSTSYQRYLEAEESIHKLNCIFTREGRFDKYWIQLYSLEITIIKEILFRIRKRPDLDVPVEIRNQYPDFLKAYTDCLSKWFSQYLDIGLQESNYALIGSYNLRVLLHRFLLDEDFLREDYGYCSIVSLMSDAAFKDGIPEGMKFGNVYRRRCVEKDWNKEFVNYTESQEWDYIIIDLLDEIWNLIQVREGCYLTESLFLQESGVKLTDYDRIPLLCEKRRLLFQKYAVCLAEKLRRLNIPVVIIENYLCEKHGMYYDTFTEFHQIQEIREMNQELKWCYRYLRTLLPEAFVTEASEFQELVFTHEDFPFGCEPYYYNEGYYLRMAIQINRCMFERRDKIGT